MNAEELRIRLKLVKGDLEKNHAVRLHRAISWLRCAEAYSNADDDVAFITLWVAFNACYAIDDDRTDHVARNDFNEFTTKQCDADTENRIYDLLWSKYSQFVRLLIDNHYVFSPFWKSVRDGNSSWEVSFEKSKKLAFHALASNNTALLLSIILDRLYILRNQLLHGGATYQSQLNRSQVRDGKNMLMELLPIFIEIMFHDDDWGEIYYPVID
jgi:hypothetical protein